MLEKYSAVWSSRCLVSGLQESVNGLKLALHHFLPEDQRPADLTPSWPLDDLTPLWPLDDLMSHDDLVMTSWRHVDLTSSGKGWLCIESQ